MTPNEIADENLRKLCAVTGASYSPDHKSFSPLSNAEYPGPWVRIELGKYIYYIAVGHIRRTTSPQQPYGTSTCYYVYPAGETSMPHAETVASALLLLKNNPGIFDQWSIQDGPHS